MNEENNDNPTETIPVHEDVLPDAHIDTRIHVGVMPHVRKPYMRVTEAAWDSIAHTFLARDRAGKDGPGFVAVKACAVADDRALRRNENVELVTMLMLDVEDHDVSHDGVDESDSDAVMAWVWSHIAPILGVDLGDLPAHIAYTTHSHGLREVDGKPKWAPNHPRIRVVVPYAAPIDPETHTRLMAAICDALPGMDTGARDLARLMYTARVHHPDAEVPAWDVRHDGTHLLDPAGFVLPEPQPEPDRPRARARARSVITAPTDLPTREDVLAEAQETVEQLTARAKAWESADTDGLIDAAYDDAMLRALATLEAASIPAPGEKLMAALKRAGCHTKTKLAQMVRGTDPIDLDAIGKLSQEEAITRTDAGFALTPEALAEALSHVQLPAGRGSYELWRDVGMALADYVREGHITRADAEAVFVGWSRTQDGFQGDEDCITKMQSFRGRGITIGTLIHHAREGGWTPPRGSAVVTGVPDDGLLVGSEAEVAKAVFAGLHTEVSPHIKGVGATRGAVTVSDVPTVVYSTGEILSWCPQSRLFTPYDRDLAHDRLAASWDGKPVISDTGSRPLSVSSRFTHGVHAFISSMAKVRASVPQEAWMRPAGCIGAVAVEGGVLLLSEDGEIAQVEDHPIWMQRSRIAAEYKPDLTSGASVWHASLDEVFGNGEEGKARQRAVQEYVGATLFGCAHRLQKILLLSGGGLNGKGVLMSTLSTLFAQGDVVEVSPHMMREEGMTGMEKLLVARLNLVGDISRNNLSDTGTMKKITGEDLITCQVKYEHPRVGKALCGHIWGANEYPTTRDQSFGFWRRWHIVRCDQSFAGEGEGDVFLKDKLARDLPAILAWAVEGAQRLIRNSMNLTIPACHHEEIAVWKTDTDSCREFVITHADEDARHSPARVYEAYQTWTNRAGRGTLKKREFLSRLKQLADEGFITRVNASGAIKYALALYPTLDTDETPTAISAHRRTPDPNPLPFTHEKTIPRPTQGWSRPSLVEDLKDAKPAPKTTTTTKPRRDAVAVLLADEMASLKSSPTPAPDHGANADAEDDGCVDTEVLFLRHLGMDG